MISYSYLLFPVPAQNTDVLSPIACILPQFSRLVTHHVTECSSQAIHCPTRLLKNSTSFCIHIHIHISHVHSSENKKQLRVTAITSSPTHRVMVTDLLLGVSKRVAGSNCVSESDPWLVSSSGCHGGFKGRLLCGEAVT